MDLNAIIENGFISPGTIIKPIMPNTPVEATIASNGEIVFDSKRFENLDEAMANVLSADLYTQSTSTGWQFWGFYNSIKNVWIPLEHLRAKLALKSKAPSVHTSESHPLRIDTIELSDKAGRIGMTFCPGKKIMGLYGGEWDRDLELDLSVVDDSGASTLITVMEDHEFDVLGVPNFKDSVKTRSFYWEQLLVKDCDIPTDIFEAQWKKLGPKIHEQLKNNELIIIHCRGGLGRTGLLAARILVEVGYSPVDAIAMVRKTRSHTIETFSQEYYILTQAWKTNG